ncbi:MAG: hypothetical protein ACRCV9_19110 [Burkholderiaceae bacterium]
MFLSASTGNILQLINNAAGSLRVGVDFVRTDQANPPVVQGNAVAMGLVANVTTAATTNLLAGVAAQNTRVVRVTIKNESATVSQGVEVQRTDGVNPTPEIEATLLPGESLHYDGQKWLRYDVFGGVYGVSPVIGGTALLRPAFANTANLTSAKTITSTNSFAVYIGKAPRALTSIPIRYRVTTAGVTITWAEVAVAKGAVNVGGNPTLTVVGHADVAAVVTTVGQKTTTVNVAAGQRIDPNDDLWLIIGNNATTAVQVRALSIADDIQVGVQASLVTRPSLNVGVAQVYTIEAATTLPAWIAAVV